MLHARPWSETSLMLDAFSHDYGRVRLLAKGARRRPKGKRAELMPFQLLRLSWSGKSSLMTLTQTEMVELKPNWPTTALMSAYYANELILKLLQLYDPHEQLFKTYDELMQRLAGGVSPTQALRRFECGLLQDVGYGLHLTCDAKTGEIINPAASYFYYPEQGPVQIAVAHGAGAHQNSASDLTVSGATLLQLANDTGTTPQTERESKRLIRYLISRYLHGRELRSRAVYQSMLQASPSL